MKFVKYFYVASIFATALGLLGSCSDDDDNRLSDAVLASAASLNFEAQGAAETLITVYADAAWETEVPAWVTVTPTSGVGTTDVTVSVSDNMRDGSEDNPRKASLVFKGRTLASRAEVLIIQNGDKYRDVKEYTVAEILSLPDEAIFSLPEATVMAITTKGFIVTDKQITGTLYVLNDSKVALGDKIAIKGIKSTDAQALVVVDCDELKVLSAGSAPTYPQAVDITDKIDSYSPKTREYITLTGVFNGSTVSVPGAEYGVSIVDAPDNMGLAELNGHNVTITGYFAGVAAPVLRMIVTEVEDKGVFEIVYFSEDFEWLDPWAEAGDNKGTVAGETVGTDDLNAYCPQIPTPVVNGVSALAAMEAKGYEFLRVTTKTEAECIYLQRNYLKFGKTSYQAGIVLPRIESIPSDANPVLSFDWCPMRQGPDKGDRVDPVNLIVIVTNGNEEVTFEIPESGWEDGHKLEWIRAEVQFGGVAISKDTKITIRQTQWPAATANRWFLDNIKIIEAY